jgi:hypothetical protein
MRRLWWLPALLVLVWGFACREPVVFPDAPRDDDTVEDLPLCEDE